MKTTVKMASILAALFCFFATTKLNAQVVIGCPYNVHMDIPNCGAVVDVIFYDQCTPSNVCQSYLSFTLSPGLNSFSCGTCVNVCNVSVTYSGVTVDVNTVGPQSGTSSCGSFMMDWGAGDVNIHP